MAFFFFFFFPTPALDPRWSEGRPGTGDSGFAVLIAERPCTYSMIYYQSSTPELEFALITDSPIPGVSRLELCRPISAYNPANSIGR